MATICVVPGCFGQPISNSLYCNSHHNEIHGGKEPTTSMTQRPKLEDLVREASKGSPEPAKEERRRTDRRDDVPMSQKYPKYYKAIPEGVTEIDTYLVNQLFPVTDDTGCILHARKKLLVPGTRTGGKTFYDDVREARDTLTRWLDLHPQK